jgi:capsular polysaccharide biosynthesis protein
LNRKGWTIVTPQTSPSPNTNVNIFSEYRYLIGGDGGALEPFTKFQLKIVMRSTNSARVPSFRDLRVIALAI